MFLILLLKWHRGSGEATQSHSGSLQHIHHPFHYSWCVFSDSGLSHEKYSCLSSGAPERARRNETKCVWAAKHWKACFHPHMEKSRCPVICGESFFFIVWFLVKMTRWWRRHCAWTQGTRPSSNHVCLRFSHYVISRLRFRCALVHCVAFQGLLFHILGWLAKHFSFKTLFCFLLKALHYF